MTTVPKPSLNALAEGTILVRDDKGTGVMAGTANSVFGRASGGEGFTRTTHALGTEPGIVQITYDMFSIPDRLDCYYQVSRRARRHDRLAGVGIGHAGRDVCPGAGDQVWCMVVMSAPNNGTAWTYTVHCPVPS